MDLISVPFKTIPAINFSRNSYSKLARLLRILTELEKEDLLPTIIQNCLNYFNIGPFIA
jgi:hypothetical protein